MNDLTNQTGLSLALAVWLADDDYSSGADQFPGQMVISATTLLKPIRQTVLAQRVPAQDATGDVSERMRSKLGHAIHDSIEKAWSKGYARALKRLGHPDRMIDKIRINPETVEPGTLPVYLEQRAYRPITVNGHEVIISGQFDQVINGELNDTKTTSVFTWIKGSKDEDYRLQGSIYRWLSPEKITSDLLRIQHVFTDWQGFKARTDPSYPPRPMVEHTLELMSLADIESWIRSRIRDLMANDPLPEPQVLRCTDKELWRSDPVFKYYADPTKASAGGRATKNFPNYPAAASYRNAQGKGAVVTIPGKVRACSYCAAFPICKQKDEYDHDLD